MAILTHLKHLTQKQWRQGGVLLVLIGILWVVGTLYLPPGIDWYETFRPAGLAVWRGESPYVMDGFRYVPWAIVPVLPFALMPEAIGRAGFLITTLVVLAYTAYRLGAKPMTMALFLASPVVVHGALNANIDWLPVLGFVLPPRLGLFFVIIKPQVGWVLVLFWLVEAWRAGSWWQVVRTFLPVSVAVLLSFVLYGFWPMRFLAPIGFWWNASLWPASIPVGLALVVAAVRLRKKELAMAAAPCLSPYVLLHSWVGAVIALATQPWEMLGAVVGLWVWVGWQVFTG